MHTAVNAANICGHGYIDDSHKLGTVPGMFGLETLSVLMMDKPQFRKFFRERRQGK